MEKIKELQSAEDWEKGMLLAEILQEVNSSREEYFDFLDQDINEEKIFNQFNIKRFISHLHRLRDLAEGYYWVKVADEVEWEVAFYDADFKEFNLTGDTDNYEFTDLYRVDSTPILREEVSDEEEGDA